MQSTSSDLDENDDMEVDENNNNNNNYSNGNSRLKQETCNCAKSGGTGSSDVMNNELNAIRNELIKLNSSDCTLLSFYPSFICFILSTR